MSCFSVGWFVGFLVWLVVVCGLVAIAMLILPIVLGWLGWAGDLVMRVIRIIVAVVVIVFLIYFLYDVFLCFGPARLILAAVREDEAAHTTPEQPPPSPGTIGRAIAEAKAVRRRDDTGRWTPTGSD